MCVIVVVVRNACDNFITPANILFNHTASLPFLFLSLNDFDKRLMLLIP